MPNPYATWVKNIRVAAKDAAKKGVMNAVYIGLDYVVTALEAIIDLDDADGNITGTWTGNLSVGWQTGVKFVSTDANIAATAFIRSDRMFVAKLATGTTTPPTPASEDDYNVIISELGEIDATGPSF